MLRRNRARRLKATAGSSKGSPGRWAVLGGVALTLLASLNNCGFPHYEFNTQGSAGRTDGGGGATSGASGVAGAPDMQGGAGTPANAGRDAGAGGGGDGGGGAGGEAGVAPCVYPEPVIYPAHCFDGTRGDGETGTDCGGGQCTACAGTQTCAVDDDCLSGKCNADKTCLQVLSAEYSNMVTEPFVQGGKFHLTLTYRDSHSTTLDQIRIRYYFNHNGVTEPVLGLNSQVTLYSTNGPMNVPSEKIHTQVYRTALGPEAPNNGRRTDSYIEISFSAATTLLSGYKLDIIQDFSASSSDVLFDQNSHYSFSSGPNSNDTVTVYREGKRLWGIEPPWVEFPECAYAGGVSLNGRGLTVGGDELTAATEAALTFEGGGAYANSAAKAVPATDSGTTELLTTSRTLTGSATATWMVPDGEYYACAWLTAAASSEAGVMTIQGDPVDKFIGWQSGQAAVWSLLGPYEVTVSHGALSLGVASGVVHVSGVKLYRRP